MLELAPNTIVASGVDKCAQFKVRSDFRCTWNIRSKHVSPHLTGPSLDIDDGEGGTTVATGYATENVHLRVYNIAS